MSKRLTNVELFKLIDRELDEKGLKDNACLDYALAPREVFEIRRVEWDTIGIVNFGGNEGIFLDLYARGDTGNEQKKIPLGTYKTLRESKEAFKAMGDLNAEFVFAVNSFVNGHLELFD